MSRANPIGLRLASKKRNPPFIGVGQYYSYNQLKYNIVIQKSIKQLNKQLAVPANQIVNRFDLEKKKPQKPGSLSKHTSYKSTTKSKAIVRFSVPS